ncbi:hypothetical protein ACFLSI_02195 [Bacteroidota bacterium]
MNRWDLKRRKRWFGISMIWRYLRWLAYSFLIFIYSTIASMSKSLKIN